MAFEFKLPDVGEGTTEGEIVRWLVGVGDAVALDQPLVELETDKALVELPSPRAGVIASVHGEPGQVVPVGTTLVVIDVAGEPVAERPAAPMPAPAPVAPIRTGRTPAVQAAPATRRLARELGVDLTHVPASGPRGRVLPGDVRAAAGTPAPAGAPTSAADRMPMVLSGLRRVMAEHMATSAREIPQVTVVERVNASELVRVRTALRGTAEALGARLTYLPWVAKALALALADHPRFNARWDHGTCYQHRDVHLGIATDTPDGLLVPVIRDAGQLSVLELAQAMTAQTERAQARKLSAGELSGSTVTITGGGRLAGLFATPLINPPEVAILGVYRIQQEAQVVGGAVVPCPMLYLSWTFDHRIADGAEASRFLEQLKDLLADPGQWLLRLR